MAQSKFLTYEGLEHLVSKVATTINGEASTESIKLTLHGKTKDSNKNVISTSEISNVIIPLAGALGNSNAGLITAAERTKLNNITNTDGEANQNAFSHVKVVKNGTMTADATVSADSKTDTLSIKAGTNISISADTTNDAITITNTYAHPDYTVLDKGPNTNQTPGFGSTFNIISKVTSDSKGHLTALNTNTVKIPSLPTPTFTAGTATVPTDNSVSVVSSISGSEGGTKVSSSYTLVNMPTKAYVDKAITDGITTSASMVLKGSFNTTSGEWYTTTVFSKGDTYVSTESVNHTVFGPIEPGDLIIANKDNASKTVKADWIIVQKNVDLVGAKDTIGLIKNGSTVTSTTGLTASPIIGGVPYHKEYSLVGNAINSTGLIKNGSGVTNKTGLTASPIIDGIPYYKDTNTTYSNGSGLNLNNTVFSLKQASTDDLGGIKLFNTPRTTAITTVAAQSTANRYYAIELDTNGKAFVNIPWTDNDTKVTAVGNHYTPAADDNSQLTSTNTNSGTASWNSTELITGIKVQRDAKGHVTGITTTSHKMPSNPNVNTWRDVQVNDTSIGSTVPLNLKNGTNVTITKDTAGNVTFASADTKNTAGSTNTSSKIFLVGATSQANNPQTYSHDTAYVGTDGCLYSDSKKVLNGAATTSALGGIKLYSEASTSAITIDANRFELKLDSTSKAYVEIAVISNDEIEALFA
jgi:hypothetical protein